MSKITLVPIAMVKPSADCIQAPSSIKAEVELSQAEFDKITDTGSASLVSLDDDKLSNPQQITAYTLPIEVKSGSKGWIGRFIVK